MRHIPEELVELADGLLDLADFAFAFDYQRFLVVDFGLLRKARFAEELLLLGLLGGGGGRGGGGGVFEGGFAGAFFFKGAPLNDLEFGECAAEFAGELLVGVALGGLRLGFSVRWRGNSGSQG